LQAKSIFQAAEEEAASLFANQQISVIQNPGVFGGDDSGNATMQDAINYLEKRSAGKDLIQQLVKAKLTFILPNGDRIGYEGYEGDDGQEIKIQFGDSVGGGNYSDENKEITIDNKSYSEKNLAEVLSHEMQHALDHQNGLVSSTVSPEELKNYLDASPQEQQDMRDRLANDIEGHIDTEIRAYERNDAVADNRGYADDGYMTKLERQNILDTRLYWFTDYEKYYENSLSDLTPGLEYDVWLDDKGDVHVDIEDSTAGDGDWWPFW